MKKTLKTLGLILVMFTSLISFSQETKEENTTSTFYFIRHAEKNRSNPKDSNPHLTQAGEKRASNWAKFFKDIPLKAIYSTQYHRTIETASPTALQSNLEIQFYDPRNLDPKPFMEKHKGSQVLIVGHSNTTTAFVNAFLGEEKYKDMLDTNNGSVFILQISGDLKLINEYHID